MRVSVVIPCYNSLRYLPQTLESVFSQDLSAGVIADYEVLLVDDGGSDDLAGWLAEQAYPSEGSARVRLLRQANAGVSAARNLGIRESTGEVIAFCDSDDLWTPTTAADLARPFVSDPNLGMSYGWYEVVEADGTSTGSVHRSVLRDDMWQAFVLDNPVSASGVMLSRLAAESSGGFAENRDRFPIDVEDWELWIRIASKWPVAVVERIVAHHRRHESNSSTDIESLEAAYEHLMEVVFADVAPQRLSLRPQARARYLMILAWQSLNERQDPHSASRYIARAVAETPELRRSAEFWRLRIAASVLGAMGERGYRAMRAANRRVRRIRK